MRRWNWTTGWRPYAVALVAFAAGLAFRLSLDPILGTQFGFMFFFPAVAVAAWISGRIAGGLTALLAAATVWLYWTPVSIVVGRDRHSLGFNVVAFLVIAVPIIHAIASARERLVALRDAHGREAALQAEREAVNRALQQQVADLAQLHELSWKIQGATSLEPVLEEVLRGALDVNRTTMGLLSLASPEGGGVTVAASCGFSEAFLKHVKFVPSASGACGSCWATRERVIVEDVRESPLFEPYRELAQHEGFRAVFSTPLIGRGGNLIGVLSVHFRERHRPSAREMQLMDLFARTTADVIENVQLRQELQRELESRRQTAEALRIANERFAVATHDERLTLFEQDATLRYTWLYPLPPEYRRAMGATDEEVLGDSAGPLMALKREVLASGVPRRAVFDFELPGGRKFFDLTVSPRRSPEGRIEGVAGAAVDITDRKHFEIALTRAKDDLARMNAELEARVRQRTASLAELLSQMEAFSFTVSHDLRAPLRAISTFAGALRADHAHEVSAEGRELLDRIIRGADRMTRMINDVLAYTRVSGQELRLTPVALGRSVCDLIQSTPELQPPAAIVTWPDDLPVVLGNEAFIGQVLSNLLSNAVKFVPSGRIPEVVITTELRGDFVRVSIQDNGIGIRPEHLSRLFGMFERVHVDRRFDGTGVGLAIVKRAVQRMNGTVGVESSDGNGSRFWFELPAMPAGEPTVPAANHFDGTGRANRRMADPV